MINELHKIVMKNSIKKQNIDTYVGKRLRLRRTMMGLSQEAIAKAVGITFQQVQKYEKGANAMNSNRLYEFAQFMHVPVAYFFDDLEQMGSGAHSKDADHLEIAKSGHNSSFVSDR